MRRQNRRPLRFCRGRRRLRLPQGFPLPEEGAPLVAPAPITREVTEPATSSISILSHLMGTCQEIICLLEEVSDQPENRRGEEPAPFVGAPYVAPSELGIKLVVATWA